MPSEMDMLADALIESMKIGPDDLDQIVNPALIRTCVISLGEILAEDGIIEKSSLINVQTGLLTGFIFGVVFERKRNNGA